MSQKKTFHPPHPPKQNPLFNNNSNNNNSNKGSIKPNNTTIYTGFDNINVSNIEYGFGNNSHNLSNYFTSNNLSNNNLFNQVDQEIIKISNLSNDLEKEWDYSRNTIDPGILTIGSSVKVNWICFKCKHKW